MSRDFQVALAVLLFVAVVVGLYRYFDPPTDSAVRQRVNMVVAQEELPKIQAVLNGDRAFKDVTAFVYTGQDGAVGLAGTVDQDDDVCRLMKAVAAERLRVAVSWQVRVQPREMK